MRKEKPEARPEDVENCASVWFLRLERSVEQRDGEGIKEAKNRLRELGYSVTRCRRAAKAQKESDSE